MSSDETIRVCVPVCQPELDRLATDWERAAAIGDLVELRLDCTDGDVEKLASRVHELLRQRSHPTILTLRAVDQGGQRQLSFNERTKFWNLQRQATATSQLIDIELDLANAWMMDSHRPTDWSRVICSHHDFVSVPQNLTEIYEQLSATPARILKIAVRANDTTDCLAIFELLDRARRERRDLIAIAMGSAGIATRILGPARGAFLTYGAAQDESATAPGQLTADQLTTLYRIRKINTKTQIYGLVGTKVMHSVSPHMHNAAFAAENVDGVYLPFEVYNVEAFLRRMVDPRTRELDWNLKGLSITAPHKAAVMSALDWIEPTALDIGAVNTVVIEGDRLLGYNTDAAGLIEPLLKRISSLKGLRVAVIGAGGAARAAVWGLQQQGAGVTLFARDTQKGSLLADELGIGCEPLWAKPFTDYDVLLNATPLGSFGEQVPRTPVTSEQLAGVRLAYDLVYNPTETEFLRQAKLAGCETLSGLEMLIAQAALQFNLWTGHSAPTQVMTTAASQALT
ncbi:MAG TPA: shikimate dehydrogenase [Pyrinomonadaceae bacterium]|nr:shikimate dehydrogenase [Pyrinomonadaceae bacterium]